MSPPTDERLARAEADLRALQQLVDGYEEWSHRSRLHKLSGEVAALLLVRERLEAGLVAVESVLGELGRKVEAMEDASELARGVADELERRRQAVKERWSRRDKILGAAVALVTIAGVIGQLVGRVFG